MISTEEITKTILENTTNVEIKNYLEILKREKPKKDRRLMTIKEWKQARIEKQKTIREKQIKDFKDFSANLKIPKIAFE
jgi:hypothetical protein